MKLSKADLKWVRRHGGVVTRKKLHEQKPQGTQSTRPSPATDKLYEARVELFLVSRRD